MATVATSHRSARWPGARALALGCCLQRSCLCSSHRLAAQRLRHRRVRVMGDELVQAIRAIVLAPTDEQRLVMFIAAADFAVKLILDGRLELIPAVDRLWDAAIAYGLVNAH